ncbi:hypothetical protein [Tabrizicola sp.]|uniref:hypothetical protein n=1 Tax=Tabrizicola sp. TaxID=2005166 RepID=UPI002736D07C|nr:hypothetical protein [Tabrizicola sp.]MDP3195322.1 hypothetical protein [Tabrizicola sp.]
MDMASYLNEVRYGCEAILPIVWKEREAVEALKARIATLTAQTEDGYRRAQFLQQFEDPDDYMMGVGLHWDTYFGADKERYHAVADLPSLEQVRDIRSFACAALAGSVLQFAKQGISLVHGGLQNCPAGRQVHGVDIKLVIWQGRNQSMHWDEGQFTPSVRACFDSLKVCDSSFNDYDSKVRSVAFDVVRLLGWREYAAFETDMMALA